ncbi:S8/S53 family peptidase [Vallitalea guaymasensis]|uniref:S8/S53 family peptidase n=1 Tax=Vallitalea guaymasensis TaxID=1185412 RepID=UPI000DE4A171|nr:S8/S53 family peptidase [Vallitalea guaymasensis]
MKIIRKSFSMLIVLFMLLNLFIVNSNAQELNGGYPKKFDTLFEADLSKLDFTNKKELLNNTNFTDSVIWPTKLPKGFNPKELIEYGKDPGLGVRDLHEMGLTGKGVSIAYIDQPLLLGHEAYDNVDLHYTIIKDEKDEDFLYKTSMHGPAVLSLLSGKEIGVAPDASVYFYATPSWLGDQGIDAKAFYQIVEDNKKLDEDDKIKIIGLSDNIDIREANPEALREAVKYAEKNGIMVFFCHDPMEDLSSVRAKINTNKDKYNNYELPKHWNRLYIGFGVPTGSRTVANYLGKDKYTYYTTGGASWATPYMVGVIALGLQINPNLSKGECVKYLRQSAAATKNIINPKGFIELVRKNSPKDYRYFLYNKRKVSSRDYKALVDYTNKFDKNTEKILIDISAHKDAYSIYNCLRQDYNKRKGRLLGIQIIGSSDEVPAFNIHFKVKMKSDIDDKGYFLSDHFYSNFNSKDLNKGKELSVYSAIEQKLKIDFIPKWPVARLPLGRGDIAKYFDKYNKYKKETNNKRIPIVDFSSPIFDYEIHNDDTGILLNRMEKFQLINKDDYRLYGNMLGKYPVQTQVLGDFSKENLKKENELGIMNLTINSHGQWDNVDQYIISDDYNEFKDKAREQHINGSNEMVTRLSLVNKKNINNILDTNYYNIFSRSCLNACNLDKSNIFYKGLVDGLLISAIGHSSIGSNNGFNVYAELKDMKYNNSAYNYMLYVYSIVRGNTISDSYYKAKKAYAKQVLKHPTISDEGSHGNQQFQLHNILSQNYLGVLDYEQGANINLSSLEDTIEDNSSLVIEKTINFRLLPYFNKEQNDFISFVDDNIEYMPISYDVEFNEKQCIVNDIGAVVDDNCVYIKIKCQSNEITDIGIFLQCNAEGLKKFYKYGVKKGDNTVIMKLDKKSALNYPEGIGIIIGDKNFILIEKQLIDTLCLIDVRSLNNYQ